jgi:hypothetical protein
MVISALRAHFAANAYVVRNDIHCRFKAKIGKSCHFSFRKARNLDV